MKLFLQVRLMYERVPRDKPALQQHLDDPVIEYVHVYRVEQEHYLTDLPMGKYIVCGEAQINGEVFQSNCFETSINRLDNNSEYFITVYTSQGYLRLYLLINHLLGIQAQLYHPVTENNQIRKLT